MAIPQTLTVTFTALTEARADELYAGSDAALTPHGFTVTKTATKSWQIMMPISGSAVPEDLNAMNAIISEIHTVIKPILVADSQTGSKSASQALQDSQPDSALQY